MVEDLSLPVDIYCLSYKNETRKQKMLTKFGSLGWPVYMYDGVGPEDSRIQEHQLSSCMLGHMDMISKFYHESSKEYGIFCEDDICIHRRLAEYLPSILAEADRLQLDLIMLGYLMNYHINYNGLYGHIEIGTIESETGHNIYTFDDNLWGTQMYMISKAYAKELLDNYGMEYAIVWKNNPEEYTCYAADWIITKKTIKRVLVYPPLCIENGDVEHLYHEGQRHFHRASYELHVNEFFI